MATLTALKVLADSVTEFSQLTLIKIQAVNNRFSTDLPLSSDLIQQGK